MPTLDVDIRQLFAHAVLETLERADEAEVRFTYRAGDVYLSVFAEAFARLDDRQDLEYDPDLLRLAQVFERFLTHPKPTVAPLTAGLMAAGLYWLAGYSANALVMARAVRRGLNAEPARVARDEASGVMPARLLLGLLLRDLPPVPDAGEGALVAQALAEYLMTGTADARDRARVEAVALAERQLFAGAVDEYVAARLLAHAIERLARVSLWASIEDRASAPMAAWREYVRQQFLSNVPLIDLWPSQRAAIAKGLLDARSSVTVRMPTSSGKTKMTELAFVNDLFTDDRRCLYLAPFRALVSEIEFELGESLAKLGIPVATLYGGSEANELEAELSTVARVVIATPEKIAAVLKLSGGSLADFGTVVLDEGHLLDSGARGVAYELQLSALRAQLAGGGTTRTLFLSAVLPNSAEVAAWLGGSVESLAVDDWQPTTTRFGVLTWPEGRSPRLDYRAGTTDPFFVPRLLEEERWSELNDRTRRQNRHTFPTRKKNNTIAAALAFRYVRAGSVIVYARQPRWAESVAKAMVDRLELKRPVDTALITETNVDAVAELAAYFTARLGPEAILTRAVAHGIAIHHGGVPQGLRLVLEHAFRAQTLRALVATNTIAQGVNFPAKTVILHSLPDTDAPRRDFWNLAGRAGRAMRETEGEVIILKTGELTERTISQFLNRGGIEPVESQLLMLVRRLLIEGPRVDPATLDAILGSDEEGPTWRDIVRAIDGALLEAIAEDVIGRADAEGAPELDAPFITFVDSLFATQQARGEDAEAGVTRLEDGVRTLMATRRAVVLGAVPDGLTRRRYSRVGLSVESAQYLDSVADVVRTAVADVPTFTAEAFTRVIELVSGAAELAGVPPARTAALAQTWIETGSYLAVRDRSVAIQSPFDDLDDAVGFVERVLVYRLPWVLNGLLRVMEPPEGTDDPFIALRFALPEWVNALPHYLRYGVNSPALVWVMSLGVQDPAFAQWILARYSVQPGGEPSSFRAVLKWALENEEDLRVAAEQEWPRYFARVLGDVLERYARLSDLLDEEG
jgi:superfamily II DNA/RNA helicase